MRCFAVREWQGGGGTGIVQQRPLLAVDVSRSAKASAFSPKRITNIDMIIVVIRTCRLQKRMQRLQATGHSSAVQSAAAARVLCHDCRCCIPLSLLMPPIVGFRILKHTTIDDTAHACWPTHPRSVVKSRVAQTVVRVNGNAAPDDKGGEVVNQKQALIMRARLHVYF